MDSPLKIQGAEWDAKTLSVCMGYDALRLSLGGKPSTFTPDEIILWLSCVANAEKPKRGPEGETHE